MAQPQDAFNYWTRRFVTDGVASSGENQPSKADAQIFGGILQGALTSLVDGIVIGGAVVYSTRALLFADLVHAAGVLGVVYADSTQAYNGVYLKAGASGSGSWSITNLALPSTFSTDLATVTAGLAAHVGTGGTVHPVATTSVAGFESAADKTKLDGIAALADVTAATNVGTVIHGVTGKTTPVDADELGLIDSAASNVLKKVTWANVKATLGALYQPLAAGLTTWAGKTAPSGTVVGTSDTQTLTNKTLTAPTINGGTFTGGTDIAVADGGTGASTQGGAQTNLGLAIGTNVQAFSTVLTFLATASTNTAAAVKTLLALVKGDVGLGSVDNTADASKPVSTLQAAADATVASTAAAALASHAANVANPHAVTKAQVGLGNVDNTSDVNKPVSTATATALALKGAASDVAALLLQQPDFISNARYRPGETPTLFTSSLTGTASSRLAIALGGTAVSDYFGAVWQIDAANIATLPGSPGFIDVVLRMDLPLNATGKYLVSWGMERAVNPVDPEGEGVELRVQNLSKNKASISNIVFGDTGGGAFGAGGPAFSPTVAGGPIERGMVISRASGADVDYQVPSTTRYVSILMRIYGATGKTNVAYLGFYDVSFARTVASEASDNSAIVQSNLDAEAATRAANDTSEAGLRASGDTAEATARGNADAALTAAKADKTITMSAAGIATGGGDLSANRTITVPAAVESELSDGLAVAAIATKAVTPSALAHTYGQVSDLVGAFAAKGFSTYRGFAVLSAAGHMRPILDEWGEDAQINPWPTRFGGYQVFPDQTGRGLGVIDPDGGFIRHLKILGANHRAFSWGYGPTDSAGNFAYYVDSSTGVLNLRSAATTSLYKTFEVDHADHGRNIGLLANDGRQAILTYDEGYTTPNALSDISMRVTRLSSYKIGLVGDTTIIAAGTASYHDLNLTVVPFTLGAGRTKLRYYPGRGQSDWVGAHSDPALTTSANNPGVAKMFSGGAGLYTGGDPGWKSAPTEANFASIVDLKEGVGVIPATESPMSGLASQVVAGFGSDAAGLFGTFAVSGTAYDGQARGTWSFENLRLGYIYHLLHCFLNSVTPVLGGVTIGWASSDALAGMSQANYRTRMITEQAWHQRVKLDLYNDATDCIVYFSIETAWPDWATNTGPFRAQWQLHNQFPTKFRVVSSDQNRDEIARAGPSGDPTYVHYSNHGDLHIGEMSGYGIKQVETAQPYPCVAVIGATANFASHYVDVLVSLMSGSLTSDTSGTFQTDPGNLGMYWTQTGGSAVTCTAAAIQSADNGDHTATVRLTLSGDPGSPSYWEVGAIFGQTAQTRPNGPHSPLRDGSSITSLDSTTIHPGWIVPSYYPSTGW